MLWGIWSERNIRVFRGTERIKEDFFFFFFSFSFFFFFFVESTTLSKEDVQELVRFHVSAWASIIMFFRLEPTFVLVRLVMIAFFLIFSLYAFIFLFN